MFLTRFLAGYRIILSNYLPLSEVTQYNTYMFSVPQIGEFKMAQYYLNRNSQETGENEVHRLGCSFMPRLENRISLGEHFHCQSAVDEAVRQKPFWTIDGCAYCCPNCHTR